MISTLLYLIMAWGHDLVDEKIPDEIEEYLHRAKHFITAFCAALEGHLLLVFVYPQFYPFLHVIERVTGFHFIDGFYYH